MAAQFERIVSYPGISRRLFGACEWNNRIIICGGLSASGAYLNDVLESSDGVIWNTISSGDNSFSPREGHVLLVHDNKLYVVGGYNGTTYFSDVWMSHDGTKWDRVSNNAFPQRDDHAVFSLNHRMFLVGGDNRLAGGGVYYQDVWDSVDGVIWNRVVSGYSRVQRNVPAYTTFNNRMHMIGGSNGATTNANSTAVMSVDGEKWGTTGPTSGLPSITASAACVFDNKVVVTGGYSTLGLGGAFSVAETALYYSMDGEKYVLGAADCGFQVAQHKMVALKNPNRMFVLFGYNVTTVSPDIWASVGNWLG